jgi:predicted enzyme related to lactoylglutathione lyase
MMSISQMPDGSLCHTEIYARDLGESMLFYAELFDWDVRNSMNGYGMWKDGFGNEGGFSTTGRPNDTGCTLYFKVDSMEDYLQKFKERGVEITQEKTQIAPDFGYYCLFKDPAGNIMGLWSKK